MWARLAILLLSVSLAQGYYCGDYPYYNHGYCRCTDGSWCAPQPSPIACCDTTKMPSWFSGQWMIVETTDPMGCISTSRPINISAPSIAIPWMEPEYQKVSNVTWSAANLKFDDQDLLHAVATVFRSTIEFNYLNLTIGLSEDPNPPANITFSYSWVSARRPACKGMVTLKPYPKVSDSTTGGFLDKKFVLSS